MTLQEQQMIDGLIGRVRGTQLSDRDPDAAARLQLGLGKFPDALYILAQTVLVQQNALEQAHTQMDSLEAQLDSQRNTPQAPPQPAQTQPWQAVPTAQPAPGPAGWLSRFFGTTPPQPTYAPPQYASPYPPSNYAPNPYGPSGTSAGGSFLRSAATTAAGVVAGEMLFTGLESMFGGHHGGFGSNFGSGMGGGPPIINEYGDHPTSADSSFYNPTHDASRSTDVPTTTGTDDAASDNFFNADSGNSNATDDATSDDFFNGDSSDDSISDDSSDFDSSSDDSSGGDDNS